VKLRVSKPLHIGFPERRNQGKRINDRGIGLISKTIYAKRIRS